MRKESQHRSVLILNVAGEIMIEFFVWHSVDESTN